jgi:hypothetical protein
MNTTTCCHANICTECYLQVRPQKIVNTNNSNRGGGKKPSPIPCPFCNNTDHHKAFQIQVVKLTSQDLVQQQQEQQRLAHEQRMKADQQLDHPSTPPIPSSLDSSNHNNNDNSNTEDTFGSFLAQDERVALFRKRSESIASSNGGGNNATSSDGVGDFSAIQQQQQQEVQIIQSIAMTPEERKQLEQEMKNQQLHPLALQVEMEAQQRRTMNDHQYHQQQQQQPSSSRRSYHSRDWNSILNAYFDAHIYDDDSNDPNGHHGNHRRRATTTGINHNNTANRGVGESLNDLVALEAAILYSMQRERQREQQLRHHHGTNPDTHHGPGTTSTSNATSDDATNRPVIDGFPLLMNRSWTARRTAAGISSTDGPREDPRYSARPSAATTTTRSSRSSIPGPMAAPSDTVVDTVALLMRGLSEEEQLAMAIAASLQEQQQQLATSSNNDDDEDHLDNSTDDEGMLNEPDQVPASISIERAMEEELEERGTTQVNPDAHDDDAGTDEVEEGQVDAIVDQRTIEETAIANESIEGVGVFMEAASIETTTDLEGPVATVSSETLGDSEDCTLIRTEDITDSLATTTNGLSSGSTEQS